LGSSQTGESEQAIYAFEKIKKIGSAEKDLRLQAFMSLGELYHEEEQYSKSDENFEAALEMGPDNPSTLNNYAYFLSLRNEQLDRAATMVKKAIAADPASTAYQDTYGWILYLQGDFTGAEEWIGKAVSAGSSSSEVLEHYGDVWIKLGNAEKARQYWQKAIDNGAADLNIEEKIKIAGIK
jgi:Tfp pilus assembly protein PilF